jgi:glycosyltransferase involved in cell wall biosynthesis
MTRMAFVDRDPPSGFMRHDQSALEELFDVDTVTYRGMSPGHVIDSLRAASRCEAVEVFFASEHALVPALAFRLLGKRVVLVHGGYDFADAPGHEYGLQRPGRRWLPWLVGSLATDALAISEQARWEFLGAVPGAAPRSHVVPLSVDPDEWPDPGVERRADRIVTFGYVTEDSFTRKGIDRFLAAAADDPDREYVLAGKIDPALEATVWAAAGTNVEVKGHLDHTSLNELLWSAGVYVQLSWHEGFGMAMAEAMLCGCVPVVSTSAALREVAGRWAVVSNSRGDDSAAIHAAVAVDEEIDRAEMRHDVMTRFPPEERDRQLISAMRGAFS